jgi:hypothetical protein
MVPERAMFLPEARAMLDDAAAKLCMGTSSSGDSGGSGTSGGSHPRKKDARHNMHNTMIHDDLIFMTAPPVK